MLTERSRRILEASVREFIETGQPVTSDALYRNYDFGIKPAMIRWELHYLMNDDFFTQPHLSGGRIPSDKAFRFFAECVLESENAGHFGKNVRQMTEMVALGRLKDFVKKFADELGLLGVCFDMKREEIWQSGFAELLKAMEGYDVKRVWNVAEDVEQISERLLKESDWWEEEPEWPRVFIGRSPVTKSSDLSLVVGRADEGRLLIFAVGPKRMDYERSVKLVKNLMI